MAKAKKILSFAELEERAKGIHQIKITLIGSKPNIWRRIQTYSDINLNKFHKILQVVMGWKEAHLYEFRLCGTYYSLPDIENQDELSDQRDSRKIKLYQISHRIIDQIAHGDKADFTYTYDLGDKWDHIIQFEKYLPIDISKQYPICLNGKMACPPEDVGGISEYLRCLKIIKNPDHEQYKEIVDWIGGNFDPTFFSNYEVNQSLRKIL